MSLRTQKCRFPFIWICILVPTIFISTAVTGCCIHITDDGCKITSLWNTCGNKNNRKKVVIEQETAAPFTLGSTLFADTSFGSIKVTGNDSDTCHVHAKITVQAPTKEEAQSLSEQVSLSLDPQGDKLNVTVNKPKLPKKCDVHANFTINLPQQAHLDLHTSFGKVHLQSINGSIKARTSHGAIHAEDITGDSIELHTSFGKIFGGNLNARQLNLNTSHGPIDVRMNLDAPADLNVSLNTSFGEINCAIPAHFGGSLQAGTQFGGIHTNFPVTTQGSIKKDKLRGQIGSGSGQLKLHTSFGSIRINKIKD